jgi:hypothetical protein
LVPTPLAICKKVNDIDFSPGQPSTHLEALTDMPICMQVRLNDLGCYLGICSSLCMSQTRLSQETSAGTVAILTDHTP